ncbi:MAG: hypothetical protein NTW12_10545 [Deltaproteobacteria bacterium]|nr:hypothetical protein [Deltaproteobacteria bacterium]
MNPPIPKTSQPPPSSTFRLVIPDVIRRHPYNYLTVPVVPNVLYNVTEQLIITIEINRDIM